MDYEKLGLKVGLEVHQQLNTGKLFCSCPCILNETANPDFVFKRKLRATASEMNAVDAAALEEAKKSKTFVYYWFDNACCLVESDSEPPHEINSLALQTIYEIALMVNAEIFQELVPMRKIVIDGSNTGGFQRTMLVARNGFFEVEGKKINVDLLVLEEDASRIIEKNENEIIYGLDRLGIPLIEFTTAPDITSPEEAKKVAKEIGSMFRRTGYARRGLGSVRQDLNISIEGGARVELKGVQELELMDKLVELEIQRQMNLIELMNEMNLRGIKKEDLRKEEIIDLSRVFINSECKFLKEKNVFGLKLKKMHALIGKELQPKKRFGTELSNYVKIRTGLKGLLHSDELPAYGISEKEINEVNSLLFCSKEDAFVLVSGEKEKAVNALKIVLDRCIIALEKIPSETRNALPEGTSEYMRPIASAARMYPETDLLPIKVNENELLNLKKHLPLTEKERFELYSKKFNLSEKLANQMKLSNYARFFEELIGKGFNATLVATILLDELPSLKRNGYPIELLSNESIELVFNALNEKKLTRESVPKMLGELSKNPFNSLNELNESAGVSMTSKEEGKKIIEEIVQKNKPLIKEKGIHAFSALMGEAMKELKGKMDGKEISELIKKEMNNLLKEEFK
ncbi:MAG: Glu-tRNA(Gln) amidotransferase subunit GatE [Candidatus Diapherotrites archaeon]